MESGTYIESDKNNELCYRFEKIEFDGHSALLDIDATYIIHLENNGRLDSVKAQLNEFQPTKDVFILHNKGYKNCKKEEYIDKPPLDLIDAFWHIFKDAQQKNYNNILILEDDVDFTGIETFDFIEDADAIYFGVSKSGGHPYKNCDKGECTVKPYSTNQVQIINMLIHISAL